MHFCTALKKPGVTGFCKANTGAALAEVKRGFPTKALAPWLTTVPVPWSTPRAAAHYLQRPSKAHTGCLGLLLSRSSAVPSKHMDHEKFDLAL